jgi:hypothetical protein
MPKGSQLRFDEAYFGVDSRIEISEEVSFIVGNGYFNRHGEMKQSVNRMRLAGHLIMFSNTMMAIDDFDFLNDDTIITINWRFSELPFLRIDRKPDSPGRSCMIRVNYDVTGEDEVDGLVQHSDELKGIEIPLICGENIGCYNWSFSLSAPRDDLRLLAVSCRGSCVVMEFLEGKDIFVVEGERTEMEEKREPDEYKERPEQNDTVLWNLWLLVIGFSLAALVVRYKTRKKSVKKYSSDWGIGVAGAVNTKEEYEPRKRDSAVIT